MNNSRYDDSLANTMTFISLNLFCLSDLEGQVSPIRDYLNNHIPMLENILDYYQKSERKTKNKILSCILSEKISFDENKNAAISFMTPVLILLNASKGLKRGKRKRVHK